MEACEFEGEEEAGEGKEGEGEARLPWLYAPRLARRHGRRSPTT